MRVTFLNRQRAAYPGGDLVQIDSTIEALSRIGVDAVYAPEGWTVDWLHTFDLVHVFHVNFGWSKQNFDGARASGRPYVVTPIFYPSVELGMSAEAMLAALTGAARVLPHSIAEKQDMHDVLATASVPMVRAIGRVLNNCELIPNGTDIALFNGRGSHWGRRLVACVTARKGDKNEREVRRECELLGIPYRCFTGIGRNQLAYLLAEHVRVFVNASGSERMSLTIGEALCSGCRVLATDQNRGNEWYGSRLRTIPCGGGRVDSMRLRGAIAEAYWAADDEWDYQPNQEARKLTWDGVAAKLKAVYAEAASGSRA